MIRQAEFPLAVRGYDRHAVDDFLAQLSALVDELEGRQLRERVVQRALDEVGEQTAGILQRANETADELAARSRAQAEGRLQRAEREAELLKAESDKYAEQVAVDTRKLWAEREQLLEEVRRLADEVLATAEDAVERFKAPEAVATELARQEAAEGSVTAGRPDEQQTEPIDADAARAG
ncbi:MAG: DivIVA domain-containing protein [Thermoleophilaceae bacterium]|nr:DivIVA domain-containing protein [Thermoleophilaceae bacterium]